MEKLTAAWTHDSEMGSVTGKLITEPKQNEFLMENYGRLSVSVMIRDSHSKQKWRIRANANLAERLLEYKAGQRLRLTGIKGDLCKGAFDNAKRQIVPDVIEQLTT